MHPCPYCPESFATRLDRDVHAVTAHDVRGRRRARTITCRRCAADVELAAGRCAACGWAVPTPEQAVVA